MKEYWPIIWMTLWYQQETWRNLKKEQFNSSKLQRDIIYVLNDPNVISIIPILGVVIRRGQVQIETDKIKAVKKWKTPTKIKEV